MTESIKGIKQHMNDPLNKVLLASAAWLRDAPVDANWRNHILSPLAVLIQNNSQPYGMRLRALHAIVSANEKSAEALFKKMLDSSSVESRVIGALGLGGLCAEESVPELLARNTPEEFDEVRLAINLALAAIGTAQALIGLGKWLLEGDDADQLFASEALASHDGEGFAMLEEAAAMEGVRIRRAAAHGLGRVLNKRADELLSRIEMEDDQAIVRNVATEMLEQRRGDLWDLSPPPDDLSNLPWLIEFATEVGLGITPGKGAYETLRRALLAGSKPQRIAALEAISRYGAQDLVLDVLKAMEAEDMEVKNAAYEALWYLSASGVNYGAAFNTNKVDQPATK
jgi:HEAT repeat protein